MTMLNPMYLKGETWGSPGSSVEHRETHAAHVFLCGDRAYKIKKAVKYPYLDFSTLDLRRSVIERELEINRVFSPVLYAATTTTLGEPTLVMRRFDENLLLANIVDRRLLGDALCLELASMMAKSHQLAKQCDADGAETVRTLGEQLSKAFEASQDVFDVHEAKEFNIRFAAKFSRCRELLSSRARQGMVRRCHADAHCGNIVVFEGKPLLFDAIEFSERIAIIDVLYDLAFLLMDLIHFGQLAAANAILNHYLDLRRSEEDLTGLSLLSLFLSIRAGVRAIVAADRLHELADSRAMSEKRQEAREYFTACLDYLSEQRPRLICIGGLSGTGKSTIARKLAPLVMPLPGAILIRSDVERKRLAGVEPQQRLAKESYTKEASQLVYGKLQDRAASAIKAGMSVLLDAVFAREGERSRVEHLATSLKVRFNGVWLSASHEVMERRLARREGDASDATPEVLRQQLQSDTGPIAWSRIDASGSVHETLESAKAALGLNDPGAATGRRGPALNPADRPDQ